MSRNQIFVTHLLGRNDAAPVCRGGLPPYRTTPHLGDSVMFPGLTAVYPEVVEHGHGTRTGRSERA